MARARQLAFPEPMGWGGRRRGAGRKPGPGRRPTPHRARPEHHSAHPVHLTLRVRSGLPSLRSARLFPVVRFALARARGSPRLRIVHYSVQSDHLHLLVEANDKPDLCLGARGLAVRLTRAINKHLGLRGRLWGPRYHGRALTTPREVRNGLVYVLMNFRKHLRGARGLDPMSSIAALEGLVGARAATGPPPPVVPARTWLLRRGWTRHGPIAAADFPRRRLDSTPRPSR